MIIRSEKQKAFSRLSSQARLHIELIEARTDYEKLLVAITYNEPSLVKYYLDGGVSANSIEGANTSPIFCAALHKNPLIVKMLLEYGANPYFEHRITHSTIMGVVFNAYDKLMERPREHVIVTEKLNNLAMIAAIMRHAGLEFDTSNSIGESPLVKFGLWVGRERKEQVLAEFLEKINNADTDSIRPTDVIARSPEAIIRLSSEDERKVASFRAGRYSEILDGRYFSAASRIFNSRQHRQMQSFSTRTILEAIIRDYDPRSVGHLGLPHIDYFSSIERRFLDSSRSSQIVERAMSIPMDISAGNHANKFEDLTISEEKIPGEYKCPGSLSIMSDRAQYRQKSPMDFAKLPEDLSFTFFKFLDRRSLANSSEVNKNWRDLSRKDFLWRDIVNNDDLSRVKTRSSFMSDAWKYRDISKPLFKTNRFNSAIDACKISARLDADNGAYGFRDLCKIACHMNRFDLALQCQELAKQNFADAGNEAMGHIIKSQVTKSDFLDNYQQLVEMAVKLIDEDREYGLDALMSIAKKLADLDKFDDAMHCTMLAKTLKDKRDCSRGRDHSDDINPLVSMGKHLIGLKQYELAKACANEADTFYGSWLSAEIVVKKIEEENVVDNQLFTQVGTKGAPFIMASEGVVFGLIKHGRLDEAKDFAKLRLKIEWCFGKHEFERKLQETLGVSANDWFAGGEPMTPRPGF